MDCFSCCAELERNGSKEQIFYGSVKVVGLYAELLVIAKGIGPFAGAEQALQRRRDTLQATAEDGGIIHGARAGADGLAHAVADLDEHIKKLPPAEYHVSLKIDGEFNVLVYADGEAILVNPGGTVRAGLPFLNNIASRISEGGCGRAVIGGELWYDQPEKLRPRVHDVARVARSPQFEDEIRHLEFSAFDIISFDGVPAAGFAWSYGQLSEWGLRTPPAIWCKQEGIRREYDKWTSLGMEGVVVRSDAAGSFKIKPRHTIDAAVIGYTENEDGIHDLLVALMRPDGTYQILGRVGGGFTDQARRDWLCDLSEMQVDSDHIETNDGLAYRWVRPDFVIEISVLDLITQSTRGQPVMAMCLDWQTAVDTPSQCWCSLRRLPLASMISPQFVRERPDKGAHAADLRLAQVSDLVSFEMADVNARAFELPKSEVLRREVYTKQLKGQTMVRKLVMWQTNKAEESQESEVRDFPAYVIAFTDYSPNRKTPLERDIRVSNSREQIDVLWGDLVKEYIVKGWTRADGTALRRAG